MSSHEINCSERQMCVLTASLLMNDTTEKLPVSFPTLLEAFKTKGKDYPGITANI